MQRRALVTGASGQDGTYLARELLSHGYHVIAAGRAAPSRDSGFAKSPDVEAFQLNLLDAAAVRDAICRTRPDVVFNLAAFSSGRGMFDDPVAIADLNGLAVARLLEAVRRDMPDSRLCQASSSEIFGTPTVSPQSEDSPTAPRSPYGAAKLYADSMIKIYRKSLGLFACSAILFNHESPLRRQDFVTRKVTRAAAEIKLGKRTKLLLGDLEAKRDWGFAGDYVRAMRLMVEQAEPRDYVLASGQARSVRELCETAFCHVGLDYRNYVSTDTASARPQETTQLVGDATRARAELGWTPRVTFAAMIHAMVDADIAQLHGTSSSP